MPAPVLVGIDAGTTSCKARAFGELGRTLGETRVPYAYRRPAGGGFEIDGPQLWDALCRALGELLAQLGDGRSAAPRVAALSVTGQMSGCMLLDERGDPLTPFLPWLDARASGEAEAVAQALGPAVVFAYSGGRPAAAYPLAKLLWLRRMRSPAWARMARVAGAKEYLVYRLTGLWVTDPASASATQLFDIRRLAWHEPALALADVDVQHLPRVASPCAVLPILPEVAADLGLGGAVLVNGSGDGPATSLACGAARPGRACLSLGASGVVRLQLDEPIRDPECRTFSYAFAAGRWFGGAITGAAGLFLERMAELLPGSGGRSGAGRHGGAGDSGGSGVEDLWQRARLGPPGAGGLLVLPYLTGRRLPNPCPDARGALLGLSDEHGPAHVARAAVEGIAYALRAAADVLADLGAAAESAVLTGGAGSQLMAEILADVLGIPVGMAAIPDGTLGAALMAGVGAGVYGSLAEAQQVADAVGVRAWRDPEAPHRPVYEVQYRRFRRLVEELDPLLAAAPGETQQGVGRR